MAATSSPPPNAKAESRWDFDSLYRTYAATVARWAARIGTYGIDVEDIVQEVFLVVNRRLPEFRREAKAATWLFRITEHTVRNWRRKQQLRRLFGRRDDDVSEGEVASTRPTPVEEIERRQTAVEVHRILDRMSERHRTVIVLFELEEMSTEQMAELMDVKVVTVRVWLHRARADFLRLQQREERRTAEREGRQGGSR